MSGKSYKKSGIWMLVLLAAALILLGGATVLIDPFFHYHAPLKGLAYRIDNERYQNDGIMRNFDYDALITGTSLTENFRTSEFDALFGVHSVKVSNSGGSLKEVNDRLQQAFDSNPGIRVVIRSLESFKLTEQKDTMTYDAYPEYLYDDNVFNDVSYVFNKEILIDDTVGVLRYTRSGGQTTDFDSYANWMGIHAFGKESVIANTNRQTPPAAEQEPLGIYEAAEEANLEQNVLSTVRAHPETQFYFFFPPVSAYYWDDRFRAGRLVLIFEAEKKAVEMLLPFGNVHVFGFHDEYGITSDPDVYMDMVHYNEDVNSLMLRCMAAGEHELTGDNYRQYFEEITEHYLNYDFDALF